MSYGGEVDARVNRPRSDRVGVCRTAFHRFRLRPEREALRRLIDRDDDASRGWTEAVLTALSQRPTPVFIAQRESTPFRAELREAHVAIERVDPIGANLHFLVANIGLEFDALRDRVRSQLAAQRAILVEHSE